MTKPKKNATPIFKPLMTEDEFLASLTPAQRAMLATRESTDETAEDETDDGSQGFGTIPGPRGASAKRKALIGTAKPRETDTGDTDETVPAAVSQAGAKIRENGGSTLPVTPKAGMTVTRSIVDNRTGKARSVVIPTASAYRVLGGLSLRVCLPDGTMVGALDASPKEFSTGSWGLHATGKINVSVGGVIGTLQCNVVLTQVHSKPGE